MKRRDEKAEGVFPFRRVFVFSPKCFYRARQYTLAALLLGAFFVSCASAPKTSFSGEEKTRELSLLPAGAQVYLWADAVKARPLLDALSFEDMSGKDAAVVLDRTHAAAAAIFPKGGERRFYLAASGAYPRARANLSFMFNKDWKKRKSVSGNSYWHSSKNNLALALGPDLALVSDVDPFIDPLEAFQSESVQPESTGALIPPEGFSGFSRGLPLAGWVNEPVPLVNGFLSAMGIPLRIPAEELFFAAARLPLDVHSQGENPAEPWELLFRVKTSSPAQARSLAALFSLARLFVTRAAGAAASSGQLPVSGTADDFLFMNPMEAAALLFANAPEQDGNALTLKTAPLDEHKVALLFNLFQVYSD